MRYMCDNANMKRFSILRPVFALPFKQNCFFVDRLIELRDLCIHLTLKLPLHHAYINKNEFSEKRSK